MRFDRDKNDILGNAIRDLAHSSARPAGSDRAFSDRWESTTTVPAYQAHIPAAKYPNGGFPGYSDVDHAIVSGRAGQEDYISQEGLLREAQEVLGHYDSGPVSAVEWKKMGGMTLEVPEASSADSPSSRAIGELREKMRVGASSYRCSSLNLHALHQSVVGLTKPRDCVHMCMSD